MRKNENLLSNRMKYDEDDLTQTGCRVNEVIDWN